MLFPDDSLLEAGAFRFGLAGVLELDLTLEASFLDVVGLRFFADAFLGIGRLRNNHIAVKT